MSVPFERIAIVGVGLIGGSIAAAIKANSPQTTVYGIDTVQGSLDAALDSGALD